MSDATAFVLVFAAAFLAGLAWGYVIFGGRRW